MILGVVGLAGSGKTTLIKSLSSVKSLHTPSNFVIQSSLSKGHKPSFLKYLRILWPFIYFLDAIILFIKLRLSRESIILDRLPHERMYALKRVKGVPGVLVDLFYKLLPRPDVLIYLHITPETSMKRKPEHSFDVVLDDFYQYKLLVNLMGKRCIVINAERDLPSVNSDFVKIVNWILYGKFPVDLHLDPKLQSKEFLEFLYWNRLLFHFCSPSQKINRSDRSRYPNEFKVPLIVRDLSGDVDIIDNNLPIGEYLKDGVVLDVHHFPVKYSEFEIDETDLKFFGWEIFNRLSLLFHAFGETYFLTYRDYVECRPLLRSKKAILKHFYGKRFYSKLVCIFEYLSKDYSLFEFPRFLFALNCLPRDLFAFFKALRAKLRGRVTYYEIPYDRLLSP